MAELRAEIQHFVREREWEQFHTPKNLVMGLAIEAAELMENFLWLPDEPIHTFDPAQLERVRHEVGDVLIYLINLTDRLGIDLVGSATAKLQVNRLRYPAATVRGSARKYTEYQSDPVERECAKEHHLGGPSE